MSRIKETWELFKEQSSPRKRFVYVVGGDGGTTKIGIASNPSRRLRDIKTNSGRFHLTVVAVFECTLSARIIERQAHAYLAEHRVGGEWFNVTPDKAIEAIKLFLDLNGTVVSMNEWEKQTKARKVAEMRETYGTRRWRAMQKIAD